MKNQMGTIILTVLCVGLILGLIWSQKQSSDRKSADAERIGSYSNKWVVTSDTLEKQRQVNAELENDRKKQKEALDNLTNNFIQVSANLAQTETTLKTTQDEMTKQVAARDTKISELENQNQALDQRALELSTSITNLTSQIDDTKRKLAASEGDKAFLEKELQRLMAEKADLERQFNDLAALRAQVSKLKEELNISRRLDWIRRGLFTAMEQKGAEKLMELQKPAGTNQVRLPSYDLNVEVNADGSVRVIPPLTNSPAATNPPPVK
jgi:chromosome segregation ATPase